MPLNYSSSKKKKSSSGSTSSQSSVKNSGLTNLGRMIAENDPQAIWSVQRRTERQDRLDDMQRRFNAYLTQNAWNNRLASLDGPIAGTSEERAFWERKLQTSENNMRGAQSRMGYNDNAVFDPTAKRDYNSAKQSYDLAKSKLDTLDAYKEFEKQSNTSNARNAYSKMTYDNLLKTIETGYLPEDQRRLAEEALKTKANGAQAKEMAARYNSQADALEAELEERYATGYDGTPEGGYQYGQNMRMAGNLRKLAQEWSERGYMAEGADIATDAMRAYAEAGFAVAPRGMNSDDDQYNFIMGNAGIADPDMDIGYIEKKYILTPAQQKAMTPNEKVTYSDLFQQDQANGTDNAERYLKWLQYSLNERNQQRKRNEINAKMEAQRAASYSPEEFRNLSEDQQLRSALTDAEWFVRARGANLASGIGAIDASFQKLANRAAGDYSKPVDWNTAAFTPHTVSETISQNQLSKIDSAVGRFAYQTAGSMADSLVVMGAAMLGIPATTAILGGSAATDSMLKAKERGASDTQAISVGLFSGVAEALFEDVSLERLLTAGTPATIKEVIKNVFLRQGITEASEEVFTTIANTLTDAILMGDKSEIRTNIRQYLEQGYSQSDAERLAAIEWAKDLGLDALGGFVSGSVFGGFEQGISYGRYSNALSNIEGAGDVNEAIGAYQRGMSQVMDENGQVRDDSANAAKQLQETYQRTMEGLTDRSTQYEEAAYSIDQQVEQGQITPEEAEVKKVFLEFAMGERSYNQPTQEQRAKRAEELDKKARGIVQNMAEKSTTAISSVQSIVDNYDSSIANPSDYFGAVRYYEEMGQQARATGNDNFAEIWKNDERYSGAITQHAAIVAFSAGKTTAAPASKIMQVTERGTGTLTYSEEAIRQLANNVKNVNDLVELLTAFANKTGFTVKLDEALADGENARFIANAMTIAINPRANVLAGLFHESGHGIQRFNPKAYAQLKADMISWYAQTQGMTNMDQMLASYGETYKGYSRDGLEIEMVNDAFGALFNRADAAEDIARWLAENKTEAEQKSFVEKLTDLIDRIVNWVKGLVNLDNVSPMQKRTVDMQVEKVQAFRKAFLDALDSASETARTAAEYYADFASDGNGHDNSMQSFADGLGFDLDEDLNLVNKDGSRLTHVTGEMIRDSKLGAMISYAREHGRISSKDMQTELNMLADILNMALEKGDNNLMMYWEVAGSMVFSALKDNSDKQYGLTVDMSTICAKTKAIVDAMSETMLRLGRGLTREEVEVVYYTTGKNGEPTPCPVCYVFSRWFGIGGLLDNISTFQKEYGKQSTKKDMEFAKRILAEIVEFKDNASKTKQKDYWSARDNAWKYGRIASDMKSKYNSWISSAEKAIANSDTIRATISELQAQQAVVDEKAAKKLQTQINKEMKKKALLTDEQRQQKFDDIEEYKKSIHEVEAWQWLIKTKLSMDKDGNFTKTEGWKPVPPEILFDLNRGAEFASQYPLTWSYRTGKGSAMGKAMMPYSDVRVGEIAQGVAKGSVKEIKMGIDPDDEIKFNPFNADDAASVKKQLEILESAVKKTRRQNLIGGMRFQSTSDFRYEYGSDYLMAFLELQAIGSNVQLYTKVIEAVDFLASMNADINLSAMPLGDGWYEDENGRHLQSSSVTGINFEAAVEMSRKYDNVQIIMVGINRNHILTCLEGDEVTFVIPFHGSGQNVAQIAYLMDMLRENLDVLRAQDYTNYQSDHDIFKDTWKGPKPTGAEEKRIKAMRQLRMDILTGKLSSGLSEEQSALLKQSKFLGDLYNRFYVDENSREFGVTLEKDVAKQVFPYEYWDKTGNYDNADINGQRFVEYCAEIGYVPRFSGYNSKGQYNPEFDFFSNGQQKGYWKLLIDRPMYANRYDEHGNWVGYGDYREQKAINVSKFKMETIDPTWQTATYGNVMGAKNHSAKTEKIAEESIGYLNQGLRYDTATKTLVPKGQEVRPTKEGVESEEDEDTDYSLRVDDFEEYKDQIGEARGININDSTQAFTEEILNGDKTIETRTSPTLRHLVGQRVGIVRTGTRGGARLVGMANIAEEVTYDSKESFDADYGKHRVGEDSEYYWNGKTKYGYVLTDVQPITDSTGTRVELPVDASGNAISTRTLAPTIDYSRGTGTGLTDTERRTLEKRVREAERNAAKEKQRAEHFKSEMRLTPKFAPNAEQTMELATELSEMFDGTGVDAEAIAQKLTKVFQNMNRATEYKQDRYAYTAMDLAQEIAEDIVSASVPQEMTTTLEGKMMRNEAVAMGTNAIMERLLQVRLAKSTKADKWNAKLQEARQALGREKTKVNRAAQRYENLEAEFANYRQNMADRIAFLKSQATEQHSKDMARLKQTRESRDQKIALRKVTKVVKDLRDYLNNKDPKTGKYVQDNVKGPVAQFLSFVDFFSATMARTHVLTQADYRELERLTGIEKIAEQSRLMELGDADAMDGNSPYLDLPATTKYAIEGLKAYIKAKLGDFEDADNLDLSDGRMHLKISDSEALDTVYELAKSIQWAVKKMNTLFAKGKYASIEQMSRDTVKHLEGVKKSAKLNPTLYNSLGWSMATPYYAFHRFGEAGDAVFENLGAGLADFARNINTILDFVDGKDRKGKTGAFTRDEQKEWSNQIVEIDAYDTIKGKDIKLKMTVTQLMSLYCLSRRDAAQNHLKEGGIALRETKTKTETISQERAVHLTADNWAHAFDKLSDRQKEVAQKLQQFMSTVGSDWGNKVTMERWGIKAFTENFYFPMATSDARRATLSTSDDMSMSLYALANSGFTKALQRHANNALVLDDIFNVFSDHMANMAKYSSMVLPMLDAMKWYNWSEEVSVTDPDGARHREVDSLKTTVKEAFGGAATQYFRQFMTDLNAADKEGGAGYDIGSRLMSHYKAAAVGANLRVALLQPTAFFRAAMVLSPSDLAKGAAMRGGQEEMMKYSGIAQWKDLGFYDTDIGRSVRRQIQGEKTKWGEIKNKAVDISMMAAEWGDKITWAALWNACKIEQRRANPNASYEDLMKLTERRFNEVIFSTQVFDSTLSRSEVMRSKDRLKKIMTAFLSEPTLSYNMVLDKFVQFAVDVQKMGKGEAWKKHGGQITKALAVYSVTNLVAALAESFADAWRDDDDDSFWKKMMDKMFGDWSEVDDPLKAVKQYYTANLMNDMSVLGKIPILKEVVSLAQGFDIGGRMDVQALQSIKNVLGIWYEKYNLNTGRLDRATKDTWYGNMTTYGAIYKTLQAASQISGIPVYNGIRDVIGIYNTTLGSLTGKLLTYQNKYGAVDKSLDGTQDTIKKAIADAVEKGTSEKDVFSHIKSTIKDRYTGAEGEPMTRDRAKQLLVDTVGMKNAAADVTLDQWTMSIDTGISYDKMKESYMADDITEQEAIDYRMKYGHVSQKDAKETVANWKAEKETGYAYADVGTDYAGGYISRSEAIDLYVKYGASHEEAADKVDLLDFKNTHPGTDDYTVAKMKKYKEFGEKAKISVDVFYDVLSYKGDDNKKDKVMAFINQQSISRDQKNALYRACGYAESTIDEAPWN